MAVNTNAVGLIATATVLTPTAPLIEGVVAATLTSGNTPRFDFGSSLIGRYGMRVTLPAPVDLTGKQWISLQYHCNNYGPALPSMDTVANGGLRVIFLDAAGNYAGFNLYGGNVPGYDANKSDGFLVSSPSATQVFNIAASRSPDIFSGAIDWAAVTGYEVTIRTVTASRKDITLYRLAKRDAPSATGTETLKTVVQGLSLLSTSNVQENTLFQGPPAYQQGASQRLFSCRLGLTIGDGVTTTNFTDSAFSLGLESPHDFAPAFPTIGPFLQFSATPTRAIRILQSASDVLSLTDASFASAGYWQWDLSGSGSAVCTRVQFWRFDGFRAAHGIYTDCVWNDADTAVEATAATVITGGLIRGAKTTALKILGGAGVYSGLSLKIDSATATYDIEMGSGGAGTYELPHITVPAGRTLRVRNNSASNAVVVKLPLGLAYSTSTAGGAITVTIPEVSVSIAAPALIAGSRVQLYSITDGTEMLNGLLGGAGLMYTALYTGNKIIRLRADHATKLPLETLGVLTASGLTFLDAQVEDDVYLGNGIDGSTVTEFAPDLPNIQVDINDPDGTTNIQRLYAWLQWYMTTEAGVRSPFFGAVSAIDSANYVIDQTKADIKLDNVAAFPVRVVGGYLSRRDGSTVIAPLSNSIQMDPGKAYAIETGVSGLTADEGNKLNQISLLALESTAQSAATAAWAAAVQATEAADNTAALLASPAPTAATVASAVWSDAKAGTLALESTAQATLAASEAVPTAAQTASAVWSHTQ